MKIIRAYKSKKSVTPEEIGITIVGARIINRMDRDVRVSNRINRYKKTIIFPTDITEKERDKILQQREGCIVYNSTILEINEHKFRILMKEKS